VLVEPFGYLPLKSIIPKNLYDIDIGAMVVVYIYIPAIVVTIH
jgi:hypothetical protein